MIYNKINSNNLISKTEFKQIQNAQEGFKNHNSMQKDDVKKLMRYLEKFERLIADEKTLMKNTHGFTRADTTDFTDYSADKNTAEFYTSAELKAIGLFMNARTSRALGVIYSHPDVYIIYNIADGILKWENKTEENFYYRAKEIFLGGIT